MPRRSKNHGSTPGVTSEAITGVKIDQFDQWIFNSRCKNLDKKDINRIIGACLYISSKLLFECNILPFGGKLYITIYGGQLDTDLFV